MKAKKMSIIIVSAIIVFGVIGFGVSRALQSEYPAHTTESANLNEETSFGNTILSSEADSSDKLKAVVNDPNKYNEYAVDVTGKISTNVQVISNISKFQIWSDPINKKGPVIIVYAGQISVAEGDTVRVIGNVGKKLSDEGPNDESVEAVCIIAQSVEKVSP